MSCAGFPDFRTILFPYETMPISPRYQPSPAFATLADGFFDPVKAASFPRHIPRFRNQRWAERVGLGELTPDEWERHFAAFQPLPGSFPQPLALRYHGDQFQAYNPQLGDGRGFLFAQLNDSADGRLLDLGTKGSGTTPWSRGGDGRLTLKGGMREVLATEMLEALGVYTSKSFSLFETGESLQRGDEPSPTRSSVLVRLSHSHIRFGSFQRHAYHRDVDRLRALLEFSVDRYMPHLAGAPDLAEVFLREVSRRSGELAASWMAAGFVHGVLNTDNMNITGESFDYGPYRFLPTFDPEFTAAYFDHSGLYAYGRQPHAVAWNLQRLAQALLPLSSESMLQGALDAYRPALTVGLQNRVLTRLGLRPLATAADGEMVQACFDFLGESQIGFDQFFFDWYAGQASASRADRSPTAVKYELPSFQPVRQLLSRYAPASPGRLLHPYFQRALPCSLLIDEIESLWSSIDRQDDWLPLEQKIASIREMGEALGA